MSKTKTIHRGHAVKILDWCISRYGKSKYSKLYPVVRFVKFTDYDQVGLFGYYEPDVCEIFVNSQDHPNINELCKTIIEEYHHYLQSDAMYQKLAKKFNYQDHPLEIEARRASNKDYKKCIKDLKKYHKHFHSYK